ISYAANVDQLFGLPENYFTDTIVNPVKREHVAITDSMHRKVASMLIDSDGDVVGQSLRVESFIDAASGGANTAAVSQPNSFTTAPQQNPPAFVRTTSRDPAGRPLQLNGPDTGTTSFLCDPVAHLRFIQVAMDAGQHWFAYFKYDPLGRLIEEGTVPQAW